MRTATESEREAVGIFAERCAAVGPSLATFRNSLQTGARQAFDPAPRTKDLAGRRYTRWWTTGVGASEGPARVCAAALRTHAGINAEYRPFSMFFGRPGGEGAQRPDVAVVFSQGLSPNAQMVVEHITTARDCHTVLFTSAMTDGTKPRPEIDAALASVAATDGQIVRLPLPAERGLMVRLVGPAVAALGALHFAEQLAASLDIPRVASIVPCAEELRCCYAEAKAVVTNAMGGHPDDVLIDDIAFLTESDGLDAATGFANKWLEARMTRQPPIWDVMAFAHGPLQAYWERPLTVVSLERVADGGASPLFDRVKDVLRPDHHHHIRIGSGAVGWGGFFAHDAAVNELCRRALVRDPRDTRGWPGSGVDAALYDIDGYIEAKHKLAD